MEHKTKKELAKAELMALPMVTLRLVTVPGPKWHDKVLCCRINGIVYLQPRDMFKMNWASEHLQKGDFELRDAIPVRPERGPYTWVVSVAAIDRMYDAVVGEVSYRDDRETLRGKISTLMSYKGELDELTMSDADIEAARQHVSNRNRLLQEAKKDQNERIASMVGNDEGDPLGNYPLSNGTLKKLERGGITTVEQLLAWKRLDLLKIGGFGRKALTEIEDLMDANGWQFGNSRSQEDAPLSVTLTHKPGEMITWREWTKDGGFGKEHQTKIEEVTAKVYWDETRQQYVTTEKYLTAVVVDGTRVSVTVDLMSENVLIGCM